MSFWTAIVLIVAIIAFASMVRSKHNTRLGYATDEDGNPVGNPRTDAELKREVEALRERIQVLERIATDDRDAKRLSADIEQLRDES